MRNYKKKQHRKWKNQSFQKKNKSKKIDLKIQKINEEKELFEVPSEDFIQLIKIYLKSNQITFEDFISPLKNKIKSTYANDDSNRYIDVNNFENFLLTKEIIVVILDPINNTKLLFNKNSYTTPIDENLLCNNDKINLDYLKSIIENNADNGKQFVTFINS